MLYSLASKEPPNMSPNFLRESDIRLIRNTYIYIGSRDNTGIAFFVLFFFKIVTFFDHLFYRK